MKFDFLDLRGLFLSLISAEVERDLIPLAQHAPQKFGEKLKTLVQLIGVFCRILRSSIKVHREARAFATFAAQLRVLWCGANSNARSILSRRAQGAETELNGRKRIKWSCIVRCHERDAT